MNPAEEFSRFADLLPEPMLLVSGDGSVLATNRSLTRIFDLSTAELIGQNLATVTTESPAAIENLLRAWSRTSNLLPGTLTLVANGGLPTPFRCEGAAFRARSASAPAVILIRLFRKAEAVTRFMALNQRIDDLTVEVSRRRRVEQALEAQHEWLRVTLESIGDAVIAADTDGCVSFMNSIAGELTGYGIEEALGRPLEQVFHIINETSRARVENPVLRVLESGLIVGLANHTVLIRKDGSELAIDDSAAPIRDREGKLLGVVLVFHDVTDRRRLERHLREQSEGLAEADRRKDEFLAMLAHELRNPLAPLLSGSHVLLSTHGADPRIQQIGEMMERQIQHLTRLIDDLLDVSRITRGTIELRRMPVSLRAVLARSLEMVEPVIVDRKHELSVTLPPESLYVDADVTRLAQVFANLLSNAAKYTESGGQISLHAEAVDETGVVRVRDSGLGISADLLPKIFELFAQGDKSLERTEGGLGLGLTVVKELVEMHEGSVEARSDGIGLGSEFVVRLPTLPHYGAAEGADETDRAETDTKATAARRVLIVDDNKDAAESLALLVGSWNCEVRLAHSGPEALVLGEAFLPELILLDIGLPAMDGYEVARRLRSQPGTAEAMLVAVTGYGRDEDRRRSRDAGFDEHLTKPVAPGALRELLALV